MKKRFDTTACFAKPAMKMKKMLLSLCFLFLAASGSAKVYSVSPSGNDTQAGTLDKPWKLINSAVKKLKAGDTLYVRAGTYSEKVKVTVAGTASAPITIAAYGEEKPVIDGSALTMSSIWEPLVEIKGNYNNVSGLEVMNSKGRGIVISSACSHATLSNMNSHHHWVEGIVNYGKYNIVQDSRIWQNARCNSATPGTPDGLGTWPGGFVMGQYGTNLSQPCTGSVYRRNVVYNNWGEGLLVMSTKDITIEDNVIYNNWSVNLYIESSQYVLAQRNLMYVSSDTEITGDRRVPNNVLLADESYAPASQNITIINNLTLGSRLIWWEATWNTTESRMVNVLIANNTLLGGIAHDPANHSNVRIINNIFPIGTKTNNSVGITYSNNLVNTSGLVKTGTFSNTQWSTDFFKLKEDATTAINKATSLAEITDDYFKTARTTSPDIGAYESPFTTGINLIDQTDGYSLYPNPLNTTFKVTLSSETMINNASMVMYDLSGKKVKVIALKELDTTIERGDLLSGIYFYNIFNNNENMGNGKLILQ